MKLIYFRSGEAIVHKGNHDTVQDEPMDTNHPRPKNIGESVAAYCGNKGLRWDP
jgi:hypothetical protein